MKTCGRCGELKPLTEFWKQNASADGYQYRCKDCALEERRNWADRNKDKIKVYNRKHGTEYRRTERHGVDQEFFDELVTVQGGGCAICGSVEKLVLDHDHRTDLVRGVLCSRCNILIGVADDNTDLLSRALGYLRGDHYIEETS